MLLAQGIIGKAFDSASRQQYEVKGPWNDPLFTPISNNQPAADSGPEASTDKADVAAPSDQQAGNTTAPRPATGLLEKLKKQFTPAPQTYPETGEGDMLGN